MRYARKSDFFRLWIQVSLTGALAVRKPRLSPLHASNIAIFCCPACTISERQKGTIGASSIRNYLRSSYPVCASPSDGLSELHALHAAAVCLSACLIFCDRTDRSVSTIIMTICVLQAINI